MTANDSSLEPSGNVVTRSSRLAGGAAGDQILRVGQTPFGERLGGVLAGYRGRFW